MESQKPKSTAASKMFAIALLAVGAIVALLALAQSESEFNSLSGANREAQRAAYEMCKAYEKAGQTDKDCNDLTK